MARISEIHYSNTHASSTNVGEFFEVALAPGEDPADFFVSTYNQDGNVNLDIALTDPGITSSVDAGSGETIYVISGATFGFLLTDPNGGANNNEAVALTHDRPRARYFLHRAAAYGRLIEETERTVEQDLEALHNMQSDLETFMVLTADKPWEEKKRAAAKDALTYVAARLKALGKA